MWVVKKVVIVDMSRIVTGVKMMDFSVEVELIGVILVFSYFTQEVHRTIVYLTIRLTY